MSNKIHEFTTEYELYLSDESRMKGFADGICFPENTEEVSEILRECSRRGQTVTVQGSRTGVGGGAVPGGGIIMSLERLRAVRILSGISDSEGSGSLLVAAGAAVTLRQIEQLLKTAEGGPYFLPPDPTEQTASIGGAASCNSSGARTYGYGAMRSYIEGLTVVLAGGRILKLTRGEITEAEGTIRIPGLGQIQLPSYKTPEVKNAAGYFLKPGIDLTDIFIGAEGTLGVITEVVFRAERKPSHIWGLIAFFENENEGLDCTDLLRKKFPPLSPEKGLISMEFFDGGSLKLLREGGCLIPDNAQEAVFMEICGESVQKIIKTIRAAEEAIIEAGGRPDDAYVAGGERMFRDFKELRHRTPVMVNEKISAIKKTVPSITKLGSDMSVPESIFRETVAMYRRDLREAGLDFVIFGHAGNCHLHCNIISRSKKEYMKGKEIFARWADFAGASGGSVSAEHGVGKLKKDFLLRMYGSTVVEEMKKLKIKLDSEKILGNGNIF